MDVSPEQIWSVATAMIPFLEHDDANRALMGSNMQRQAVPLLKTDAPLIGTGMERRAAIDTGDVLIARSDGTVDYVDATRLVIATEDGGKDEYDLQKFMRSNQGTLIHQKPRAKVGQAVKAGDVLADGSSTDTGEMALGKNLMVAFMSWEGYNFEDAIILSERLVKDDELTSIHIEEYEIDARTTKLGDEEITRDIPNRSEESLRNLDDRGIVRIGAEVQSGDLLVGKVTPKGETELTAEEKLIRAIFKEKAREVRDTSLKVPHGEGGVVIDVKTFSAWRGRRPLAGGQRPGARVRGQEAQDRRGRQARGASRQQGRDLQDRAGVRHAVPRGRLAGRRDPQPAGRAEPHEHRPDPRDPPRVGRRQRLVRRRQRGLQARALDGPTARPGHGQGLRRHAGVRRRDRRGRRRGARASGRRAHQGAIRMDVDESRRPGRRASGKVTLFNGRSGEPFEDQVTVGYMYILKLLHLVDDKIHARSTGPYSLVTQQPLGGKAQFGGQRFGEMEVWALEAYGAAYTLQEMLTIKSDDTVGRVKAYEAIVKGENIAEPSIPESFKVLLKEMQSLALDVNVVSEEGTRAEMGDEDDDLLRAAEELGIDLSGVRAGEGAGEGDGDAPSAEAADEAEEQEEIAEGDAGVTEAAAETDSEYIEEPVGETEADSAERRLARSAGHRDRQHPPSLRIRLDRHQQLRRHRDRPRVLEADPLVVERARSRSRRPSTTARSSPRRTACSASASSVRPRTGSATAASTSASATRASSASAAASRSRAPRCAASAWGTSTSPPR